MVCCYSKHYHSACCILYVCRSPPGLSNQRYQAFFILIESAKLPSKKRLTHLHSGGAFPMQGCHRWRGPKSQPSPPSDSCLGAASLQSHSFQGQGCDGYLPTAPDAHGFAHLSPKSVSGQWGMGPYDVKSPLLANDSRSLVWHQLPAL